MNMRISFNAFWLLQAVLSWLVFETSAFAEGVFRTIVLEPYMSHAFTEFIGIIIVLFTGLLIARWFLSSRRFPRVSSSLIAIGAVWVVLTVVFEFLFFGLVIGMPLVDLVENYNVREGHLFPLGLLLLLFLPWLAATSLHDGVAQFSKEV